MKKVVAFLVAGMLMLGLAREANASLTQYTDRSSLTAQGVIDINSNFLDYSTGINIIPNNSITRDGVSYYQVNGIIGPTSGITKTEQILAGQYIFGDTTTSSQSHYNIFGADIAQYHGTPITITIYTDKNTYTDSSDWVSNMNTGHLSFRGGVLSGEYIKGFSIKADNAYNGVDDTAGVGITNLTLGHSPAPEPSTYALMGIGGLLLVFRLRKSGIVSTLSA